MKLFNQEKWDEANSESKTLVTDYELELKSQGKSKGSIYQYITDIKGFVSWAVDNLGNKSLLRMKKRDFRIFFLAMQEDGASNARINRMQSSIRNLLQFAEDDEDDYEDYQTNAMRKIKGMPKLPVREIVFLSDEQISGIIDYLLDIGSYQKALYVSLSYDSAGRRNEVFQVKKEGFLDNNQTNEVVGKRSKKFKLLYFSRTKEIAKKYFEQRGEDDIDSLWVTGTGDNKRPVSYETLYDWTVSIRPIINELFDADMDVTPHSFRHATLENMRQGEHYALKELGKGELSLDVLKVVAHHSDVSTTQSYLKNHDDDILADTFGIELD